MEPQQDTWIITEVMRHNGSTQLIAFLNNVRTAGIKPCDMDTQPDQNDYLMRHCTFLWKI